jgi:hypothetical protein
VSDDITPEQRLQDELILAARARLDAVTPGEWVHGQWQYEVREGRLVHTHIAPRDDEDLSICVALSSEDAQDLGKHRYVISGCGCCGSPSGSKADAEFIAHAPDDVRRLLALVDALNAEIARRDQADAAYAELQDRISNLPGSRT